ncbi:MAG: T9SS type A sorting domain-containing protein [Bacteroidota bacterium]
MIKTKYGKATATIIPVTILPQELRLATLAIDGVGGGYLQVGGSNYNFTYATDEWVEVRQRIDFGRDESQLFIGGRLVRTFRFSLLSSRNQIGTRQLSGINFYPVDNSYLFYIDAISLNRISSLDEPIAQDRNKEEQSAPERLTVDPTLEQPLSIEAFPNPASDYLNIRLNGVQESAQVHLLNMMGQSVLQRTVSPTTEETISVSVAALPKGTYFVRVVDISGTSVSKKVLVQ